MPKKKLCIWNRNSQLFFCGRKGDQPGENYIIIKNGKLEKWNDLTNFTENEICSLCLERFKRSIYSMKGL